MRENKTNLRDWFKPQTLTSWISDVQIAKPSTPSFPTHNPPLLAFRKFSK